MSIGLFHFSDIGVIEAIAQEIIFAEFIALRAPVAHSEHGDHLHRIENAHIAAGGTDSISLRMECG